MSEATDKLILAQLKRIADALERQSPKRDDTFTQPWSPTPWVPYRPIYGSGTTQRLVEGEGDWQLQNDDHTGEETE